MSCSSEIGMSMIKVKCDNRAGDSSGEMTPIDALVFEESLHLGINLK